jgi:sulfite reductase (ferredoxin)
MRVRITGGRLTTEQLRAIGEVSEAYARGSADITDRQNIQFHWVRIEDVPAIWERLEAVGLSTTEACGDCPRGMLGSPVAGVAEDEIIDGTGALAEIVRRYVGDPRFSNLPRKYKTAVSGSPLLDVAHEINDISFVGVVHPEHGPGFDLWVGGGLSTNPRFGVRLGAWVPEADVPDVWEAVTSVFRDYGYRRLRNRARLKFLVADWGAEKFREVVEDEYLGRKLIDGPAPEMPAQQWRDHVGVHRQKDGRFYVGFAPRVGRMDGSLLAKVAELAEEHGSRRVSTTVEQKMIILDVPEDRVASLVDGLESLDLRVSPAPFRRGPMACTGIEFCKLAIVATKERGSDLIDELERRLPDFDEPLTININGCPNACARIQTADIGLKGQLVTDAEGKQVGGYQVHLGGALGLEPSFGRKVRGLKVTSEELPDYIERVLKRYQAEREDGDRFATWAARASEEALS